MYGRRVVPERDTAHTAKQTTKAHTPNTHICVHHRTGKVGRQGRVHEDEAEEVLHVLRDGEGGDGVKDAQRVRLVQEVLNVPLVQAARDDEHHVVDHVAVGAVLQKGGQRLRGVLQQVVPVVHKLACAALHQCRRVQRAGLVGDEGRVVRAREVELDVLQVLALAQVVVVGGREQAQLVAPDDALCERGTGRPGSESVDQGLLKYTFSNTPNIRTQPAHLRSRP